MRLRDFSMSRVYNQHIDDRTTEVRPDAQLSHSLGHWQWRHVYMYTRVSQPGGWTLEQDSVINDPHRLESGSPNIPPADRLEIFFRVVYRSSISLFFLFFFFFFFSWVRCDE